MIKEESSDNVFCIFGLGLERLLFLIEIETSLQFWWYHNKKYESSIKLTKSILTLAPNFIAVKSKQISHAQNFYVSYVSYKWDY